MRCNMATSGMAKPMEGAVPATMAVAVDAATEAPRPTATMPTTAGVCGVRGNGDGRNSGAADGDGGGGDGASTAPGTPGTGGEGGGGEGSGGEGGGGDGGGEGGAGAGAEGRLSMPA